MSYLTFICLLLVSPYFTFSSTNFRLSSFNLLNISLPNAIYGHASYYDKTRNIIWIFGGKDNNRVFALNLHNFTFQNKPNFSEPIFHLSKHSTVIDDIVYLTDDNSYSLRSYNLSNGYYNNSVIRYPNATQYKQITSDKHNKLIYLSGGQHGEELWAYNVTNNDLIVNLPKSTFSHYLSPSEFYNNKLCLLGGFKMDFIECINTINIQNNSFYVLNDTFNTSLSHYNSAMIKYGIVLIFGGRLDDKNSSDTVYVFNMDSEILYLSSIRLYIPVRLLSAVYVEESGRIFLLGGYPIENGRKIQIAEVTYENISNVANTTNFPFFTNTANTKIKKNISQTLWTNATVIFSIAFGILCIILVVAITLLILYYKKCICRRNKTKRMTSETRMGDIVQNTPNNPHKMNTFRTNDGMKTNNGYNFRNNNNNSTNNNEITIKYTEEISVKPVINKYFDEGKVTRNKALDRYVRTTVENNNLVENESLSNEDENIFGDYSGPTRDSLYQRKSVYTIEGRPKLEKKDTNDGKTLY